MIRKHDGMRQDAAQKKRVPFGRKILATTRELPISMGMKSYQADIKAY